MLLSESIMEEIDVFIQSPFPLWETHLTGTLVAEKFAELQKLGISDRLSYNTASVQNDRRIIVGKQYLFSYEQTAIYLEEAAQNALASFYEEHGLMPLSKRELIKEKAATKLKAALNLLSLIPECISCIASLVNCIQVIASEGHEYDASYSHPDIPFTIFVSVCEDDDPVSNLRVAEGILHEAMHLKMSLIQRYAELIELNTLETFYSPWRQVQRPLMGVLHGLFVFRAIYDFLQAIKNDERIDNKTWNAIAYRMSDIETDFQALKNFSDCGGLTNPAKEFVDHLRKIGPL